MQGASQDGHKERMVFMARRGHGKGSIYQVRHFGAYQIAPQEQEVENKMTS
jgi:hypothetical protein